MHRSAQRAGGISIRLLAQNVAAQIVGIHPSGAAAACRGVMRVISADQLSQLVINIGDLLHAIADGDDISAVIVDVAQISAHLRNGFYQMRGAASAMTAQHIAIGRQNRRFTYCYCLILEPSQPVIVRKFWLYSRISGNVI